MQESDADTRNIGGPSAADGGGAALSENNLTDTDRDSRLRLDRDLREVLGLPKRSPWWPNWTRALEPFSNWNDLLPQLHAELEAGRGEITNYFVDSIVDIAVSAIPVIDETESAAG